jgi:hypothetical protein
MKDSSSSKTQTPREKVAYQQRQLIYANSLVFVGS